jgi:hypothetical protein
MYSNIDILVIQNAIIQFCKKWNISLLYGLYIFFSDKTRILEDKESIDYGEESLIYDIESYMCLNKGRGNPALGLEIKEDIKGRSLDIFNLAVELPYSSEEEEVAKVFIESLLYNSKDIYKDFKLFSKKLNDFLQLPIQTLSEYVKKAIDNELAYSTQEVFIHHVNIARPASGKVILKQITKRPKSKAQTIEDTDFIMGELIEEVLIRLDMATAMLNSLEKKEFKKTFILRLEDYLYDYNEDIAATTLDNKIKSY